MARLRCVLCREHWTTVELLVCNHCAKGLENGFVDRLARDFQQYRCLVHSRFSDSRRFYHNLRVGYRAADFEEVAGPCGVRVIGQQADWEHGVMAAGQLVLRSLAGIGIGDESEIQSVSVTLLQGGNRWTMVECRGLLGDELGGVGGVGK